MNISITKPRDQDQDRERDQSSGSEITGTGNGLEMVRTGTGPGPGPDPETSSNDEKTWLTWLPEDVEGGGVESPDKEFLWPEGLDDDSLAGSGQVCHGEISGGTGLLAGVLVVYIGHPIIGRSNKSRRNSRRIRRRMRSLTS